MIKTLDGIRKMPNLPGLMFIVDINKEHGALSEAQKLGIDSVAIVDTNCDPETVTYPVPGNDDALRSIELITHHMADAVIEGRAAAGKDDPSLSDAAQGDDNGGAPVAAGASASA